MRSEFSTIVIPSLPAVAGVARNLHFADSQFGPKEIAVA
jgi:hypothetical protein